MIRYGHNAACKLLYSSLLSAVQASGVSVSHCNRLTCTTGVLPAVQQALSHQDTKSLAVNKGYHEFANCGTNVNELIRRDYIMMLVAGAGHVMVHATSTQNYQTLGSKASFSTSATASLSTDSAVKQPSPTKHAQQHISTDKQQQLDDDAAWFVDAPIVHRSKATSPAHKSKEISDTIPLHSSTTNTTTNPHNSSADSTPSSPKVTFPDKRRLKQLVRKSRWSRGKVRKHLLLPPDEAAELAALKAAKAAHEAAHKQTPAQRSHHGASAKTQAAMTPHQVHSIVNSIHADLPKIKLANRGIHKEIVTRIKGAWWDSKLVWLRITTQLKSTKMHMSDIQKTISQLEEATGGYIVKHAGRSLWLYRGAGYTRPAEHPLPPKQHGPKRRVRLMLKAQQEEEQLRQ